MKNKLNLLILFGLALAIPRLTWGVTYSKNQTLASLTEDVLTELDGATGNVLITITSTALEDFDISFKSATTVANATSATQDILIAPAAATAAVTIKGSLGANGRVGDITNTGTGARTFKKTVTATSFTAAAGGAYTFEGALDLAQNYVGSTGNDVFKETVTIKGTFTPGGGTTTFEKATTITGGIVSTADNDIINIKDTFTGGIALNDTTALNFADGITYTGAITGLADAEGVIAIQAPVGEAKVKGVTIVGSIGVDGGNSVERLTFDAGANLSLKNGTVAGSSSVESFVFTGTNTLELLSDYDIESNARVQALPGTTIKLNNHTLDLAGTEFDTDADTTIELTLNSDTDFGNIVTTANANSLFAAGTVIKPTIDYLIDGDTKDYTIIDTADDQEDAQHVIATESNTALYTFTVNDATNNHVLTATRKEFTNDEFNYSDNGDKVAAILEGVAEDKDGGDIQLSSGASADVGFASLAKIKTANDLVAAVETLDPDVSGGVSKGTFLASSEFINTVDSRLTSVTSGASSGDHHYSSALWMKAYGGKAEQEAVDGIAGYDADVFGTAIGFDTLISSNLTLGVAVGFSDTDVETSSIQNTDITSYTGIAYGKFGISNFYADAFAAYSKNSYKSTRTIFNSQSASADYDGDQYSFKLKLGYDFKLSDSLKLTPLVSIHNSSLTTDAYSETGTSGLNLDVDKKDTDMLKLGLGLEVGYALSDYLVSSFRIMGVSDSELETVKATSSFSNITGDTLTTKGATSIDKSSILAGFGLTYLGDAVSLSGNYNYETKEKYKAHSFDLLLRVEF